MRDTMSNIRRVSKSRKIDHKGRSKGNGRFVKLDHYLLSSAAWKALRPGARALYVALAQRYNGNNNGEISMSCREAAKAINVNKDTASLLFDELQEAGFIHCNQKGSFDQKLSHASIWILTEYRFKDKAPTKDFMRWKPQNLEHGPKQGDRRSQSKGQFTP